MKTLTDFCRLNVDARPFVPLHDKTELRRCSLCAECMLIHRRIQTVGRSVNVLTLSAGVEYKPDILGTPNVCTPEGAACPAWEDNLIFICL